jgi:adenosylcobinamide kinase/adenosylcobinamide-phosphate guanylyltransferase
MAELAHPVTGCELILGGQKSGKSRRAESLAATWLAGPAINGLPRQATLVATALAWDDEMRQRIARHQADRALRVPGMATLEEPVALAQAITRLSAPHHLLVVDCLTLWLTNLLMPADAGANAAQISPVAGGEKYEPKNASSISGIQLFAPLIEALRVAPGPVVMVGNEIGLGVIPMGAEVRQFVDTLGLLNQAVAAASQRVVLTVAGLPWVLKQEQSHV